MSSSLASTHNATLQHTDTYAADSDPLSILAQEYGAEGLKATYVEDDEVFDADIDGYVAVDAVFPDDPGTIVEAREYLEERHDHFRPSTTMAIAGTGWGEMSEFSKYQECMVIGYELGWYDEPRSCLIEDVADEVGLCPANVSARLRKGLKSLIASTFPEFDADPDESLVSVVQAVNDVDITELQQDTFLYADAAYDDPVSAALQDHSVTVSDVNYNPENFESVEISLTGPENTIKQMLGERLATDMDRFDLLSLTSKRTGSGNEAVADLTRKQRETLRAAVETGYMDVPRTFSTEELADVVDVSKGGTSQRIRRGSKALIESELLTPSGEPAAYYSVTE